jgi:hypothetical protein
MASHPRGTLLSVRRADGGKSDDVHHHAARSKLRTTPLLQEDRNGLDCFGVLAFNGSKR